MRSEGRGGFAANVPPAPKVVRLHTKSVGDIRNRKRVATLSGPSCSRALRAVDVLVKMQIRARVAVRAARSREPQMGTIEAFKVRTDSSSVTTWTASQPVRKGRFNVAHERSIGPAGIGVVTGEICKLCWKPNPIGSRSMARLQACRADRYAARKVRCSAKPCASCGEIAASARKHSPSAPTSQPIYLGFIERGENVAS